MLHAPMFTVRRAAVSGFALFALCAMLAAGFVGATWRGAEPRSPNEESTELPAEPLAVCSCPEPDDRRSPP